MNQMMELRALKKKEYFEEEALLRQDKRKNLEILRSDQSNLEERRRKEKYGPSVWTYEPDFYKWGQTSPSYSMLGKHGKGFIDSNKNKFDFINFENNVKLIAGTVNSGIVPGNSLDAIYSSPPKYSFSKSKDRFQLPKLKKKNNGQDDDEDKTGPGSFFKMEFVPINMNKNKLYL